MWGMIIDFDGKVFDRTLVGIWSYRNFTEFYKLKVPPLQICLNIKKEKGFIIGYRKLISNDYEWKQYKMELDGKFTILTNGIIKLGPRAMFGISNSLIPTIDESYSFIYKLNNTSIKPVLQDQIVAELIGYNRSDTTKVYLYHQTNLINNLNLQMIMVILTRT
jgi:hypothetical protein